jgi:hypothetical protein
VTVDRCQPHNACRKGVRCAAAPSSMPSPLTKATMNFGHAFFRMDLADAKLYNRSRLRMERIAFWIVVSRKKRMLLHVRRLKYVGYVYETRKQALSI